MLEDLYLRATIGRHRVAESSGATPHMVRGRLAPKLRQWGGKWLEGVTVSGSYAKGTAIRGESLAPSDVDVDLFLSMSPEMCEPLAEMQRKLCGALREYDARIANVSVRIGFENRRVDLVVGRRREDGDDHSLWRAREGTWVRTWWSRCGLCARAAVWTRFWRSRSGGDSRGCTFRRTVWNWR